MNNPVALITGGGRRIGEVGRSTVEGRLRGGRGIDAGTLARMVSSASVLVS